MANFIFQPGHEKMMKGEIDYVDDDIRALLVDTLHDGDDEDEFVGDIVTLDEINEAGYGRVTLAGKAVARDDPNDEVEFDFTDPAFGSIVTGGNINRMLVYKFITNDAASPLLHSIDLTNTPTNGAAVTVNLAAEGLYKLGRAAGS